LKSFGKTPGRLVLAHAALGQLLAPLGDQLVLVDAQVRLVGVRGVGGGHGAGRGGENRKL
jgi:hypothetical protein